MLVELSVMEQRYQAVLAVVQDGWKVVEDEVLQVTGTPQRPVSGVPFAHRCGGRVAPAVRVQRS